jgi:cellulase
MKKNIILTYVYLIIAISFAIISCNKNSNTEEILQKENPKKENPKKEEPKKGDTSLLAYSKPFYLFTETKAYEMTKQEKDPYLKKLYYQIAATPTAEWFEGVKAFDDSTLKRLIEGAKAQQKTPIITLYGIPYRDCGSYSTGGHKTAASYKAWIDRTSAIIGKTPIIVIVEPDAHNFCLKKGWKYNDAKYKERAELLTYVGKTFTDNNPNALLYLHIGGTELKQEEAAQAVIDGGIRYMRGFVTNVADHRGTPRAEKWSEEFVQTLQKKNLGTKYYVIDTSRNGIDSPKQTNKAYYYSCNNFNAALGVRPTTKTSAPHADAYLWIKHPGLSDGTCANGDPEAGSWYPAVAKSLVQKAIEKGIIEEWKVPNNF